MITLLPIPISIPIDEDELKSMPTFHHNTNYNKKLSFCFILWYNAKIGRLMEFWLDGSLGKVTRGGFNPRVDVNRKCMLWIKKMKGSLLNATQVALLLNISKPTLWRYRKKENFPQPINLSPSAVRWWESDIFEYLNALTRVSPVQPPQGGV